MAESRGPQQNKYQLRLNNWSRNFRKIRKFLGGAFIFCLAHYIRILNLHWTEIISKQQYRN